MNEKVCQIYYKNGYDLIMGRRIDFRLLNEFGFSLGYLPKKFAVSEYKFR